MDPDQGRVYLDRVPVAMFSLPLARFQQRLNSLDKIEVSHIDMENAVRFLGTAIDFFENEKQCLAAISGQIDFLVGQRGKWEQVLEWANGIKPNGGWWHKDFLTVLLELKNVVGLGGDAALQATVGYSKIISQERVRRQAAFLNLFTDLP